MARVALTKINGTSSYPTAGVTVSWTAADTSNKNSFRMTRDDLLLIRGNGGAGTYTVNTVANNRGRTADISAAAIASGAYRVIGPFKQLEGWQQSDGHMYFEGSAVEVEFAVIKLPRP